MKSIREDFTCFVHETEEPIKEIEQLVYRPVSEVNPLPDSKHFHEGASRFFGKDIGSFGVRVNLCFQKKELTFCYDLLSGDVITAYINQEARRSNQLISKKSLAIGFFVGSFS